MKTINKIVLITFFIMITVTNLFAQELQYEPFAGSYNSYENPFSNDYSTNWLLPSQQDYFSMRDDLFSDFILSNSDWLMLAIGPPPTSPGSGGRPGDFGASGAIGHIPVGDGTNCLLLIIGLYISLLFYTRIRKHPIWRFA